MPESPSLAPRATEAFGPYEVFERLGMGGMAQVHRAKKRGPEGFEQNVALKRMLAHLAEDQTFVESFVREAKVVSMLVHPNIAQVYDFGRIRGIYYIAMELVAGFDVRKLLRYASRSNEAIPLPVVMSILGELCDALDHAHNFVDDQGTRLDIVHRDISPSNLIVAQTGHLKVIDFGIAKASSRQLHTESGKVKGKLGYMSPEAALGLNSGPVSDMFSLGVVAWELITASPLFTTRTDMETMQRIREGTIAPPSHHNPTCPEELDQLILSALEREPRMRLSSAAAFRAGLDDIAQRNGISISARSVVEWIGRFALPSDNWPRLSAREKPPSYSPPVTGMDPTAQIRMGSARRQPTEAPRASASPRVSLKSPPLRRSAEHIALASEIWGEDQGSAPPPGPDFSIQDLRSGAHAMPSEPPRHHTPQHPSVPQIARHHTPQHPSMPQIDPAMRASGPATHGSIVSLPQVHNSARMSNLPLAPSQRPSDPPPGSYDSRQHSQPLALPAMLPSQPYPIHPSQPQLAPPTRSKLPFLILGMLVAVAGVLIAILVGRGGNDEQIAVLDKPVAKPEPMPTTAEPIEPKAVTDEPKVVVKDEPKAIVKDEPVNDQPVVNDEPVDPVRKPPVSKPPANTTRKPRIDKPNRPEPPEQPPVIIEEKPPEKPVITEKPPEKPPEKPLVPEKPQPSKPARTPVVAASAVTKLSGEVPQLRSSGDADMITAKVCLDETGRVTGVTSKGSADIVEQLQRGLASWRYKPYVRDGKPSAVCFPLTMKLIKR